MVTLEPPIAQWSAEAVKTEALRIAFAVSQGVVRAPRLRRLTREQRRQFDSALVEIFGGQE